MFTFKDKVVLITGAEGNLGKAVTGAFLETGATLILTDHQEGRLASTFPNLLHQKHFLMDNIDLSSPDMVESLVKNTISKLARIDILIHTVGGYQAGKVPHQTSLEVWDDMHNLNARTTFLINRAVIPSMIKHRNGAIVNIASGSALSASSKDIAYSSSKSSVARITESMSKAYKEFGISVNAVLPGIIDTHQNREAMPNADFTKWVKPEAIAQVILFLSSDAGRVVNGALIPILG